MNVYHNALLTWSFQKALNCTKVDDVSSDFEELNEDLAWTQRCGAHSGRLEPVCGAGPTQ